MNKIVTSIILSVLIVPTVYAKNVIGVDLSTSTRSNESLESNAISLKNCYYDSFFGFPSRSIWEIGLVHNRNDSGQNHKVGGLSKELIMGGDKIYLTIGLGGHINSQKTPSVDSRFAVSKRFSIGTKLNSDFYIEAFYKNLSQIEDASDLASGHRFAGIFIGYKF